MRNKGDILTYNEFVLLEKKCLKDVFLPEKSMPKETELRSIECEIEILQDQVNTLESCHKKLKAELINDKRKKK